MFTWDCTFKAYNAYNAYNAYHCGSISHKSTIPQSSNDLFRLVMKLRVKGYVGQREIIN